MVTELKDPTSWAPVQGTELVKGGGIRLAVRRAGNPWSFGDFSSPTITSYIDTLGQFETRKTTPCNKVRINGF